MNNILLGQIKSCVFLLYFVKLNCAQFNFGEEKQNMQPLYQTSVKAQGGRNGKVVSDDGVLSLDVKMPKELGGPGEPRILNSCLLLGMPLVLTVR